MLFIYYFICLNCKPIPRARELFYCIILDHCIFVINASCPILTYRLPTRTFPSSFESLLPLLQRYDFNRNTHMTLLDHTLCVLRRGDGPSKDGVFYFPFFELSHHPATHIFAFARNATVSGIVCQTCDACIRHINTLHPLWTLRRTSTMLKNQATWIGCPHEHHQACVKRYRSK